MPKHSVSTQFITAVHWQVLVCMRLQCLLGLQENLAGYDDNVLSLMVNNIRLSPYILCTQVLGLEVNTPVNVEEVPAIVLCSRPKKHFLALPIGDPYDAITKNFPIIVNYLCFLVGVDNFWKLG